MRVFFGLGADELRGEIDAWRNSALPPFMRPVPAENLHITLAYIGEIDERQCRKLRQLAAQVTAPAFALRLDAFGYWPRQEVCFLAPQEVPASIHTLVDALRALARRAHLRVERRQYHPHLTLARKCLAAPPVPLTPPDFPMECRDFTLYESRPRRQSPPAYEPIESWSLA